MMENYMELYSDAIFEGMEFATEKDVMRAESLGKHKSAINKSEWEIARSKASSEASLIQDKRKILGRLEAMANRWKDFQIVDPFIEKCLILWPDSQYTFAYNKGIQVGKYLKKLRMSFDLPPKILFDRWTITQRRGNFISGHVYDFDSVGIIIFNTYFHKKYFQ